MSFAENETRVPAAVRILADLVSRKQHFPPSGLPRLSTLYPALDPLATTLTAVPTIGPATATAIALRFKDFPTLFDASTKELQEVEGVGKVLAERIRAHFHGLVSGPVQTAFGEEI